MTRGEKSLMYAGLLMAVLESIGYLLLISEPLVR